MSYARSCSFLGAVDLIGTMYEDDVIATSFGNYVCLPLLRKAGTNLSKEEAKKVLEDCLRVLFYRNTKSSTRVSCFARILPLPTPLGSYQSIHVNLPGVLAAKPCSECLFVCNLSLELSYLLNLLT